MTNSNKMTAKKIILRSLVAIAGVLFIGFGVLVIHIYQVTHKPKSEYDKRQMARIDFLEPINASQAAEIQSFTKNLPGVDHTFFNAQNGILVYSFINDKQTSLNVFNQLTKHLPFKAKPYTVSAEDLTQGCPAIGNKNTLRYKLSNFIAQL